MHFTVVLNSIRAVQWLTYAKALAAGLEKSYSKCISQGDFENECTRNKNEPIAEAEALIRENISNLPVRVTPPEETSLSSRIGVP